MPSMTAQSQMHVLLGCSILHNTSIEFFERTPPSAFVKAITFLAFPLASFVSPALMGVCLVYDQLALGIGQYQLAQKSVGGGGGGGMDWANWLFLGAGVTAAVTGLRYYKDKRWV